MKGYVLAFIDVEDPSSYAPYAAGAPATIAAHGGKYLIRNRPKELREGALPADRLVVLEFPSVAQARAWYESPEYQALVPIRQGARKDLS
ncbi:DUF1330 domain-containing protein [Ottowia beijingensis]|uniref:DUF1330 domain-containing protein n=1 Tax=Ottowia beijingensis TaxID=1207057 RepID=A0A853IZV1_9BURK|nr:DUF1330 domain-containing protein [Ottowia beijingensis]NZA03435.1 DUF1330 domain-containing protein [Ottowia beijingensis]